MHHEEFSLGRQLYSIEAEQAVIGAALINSDCVHDLAADGFVAGHFSRRDHQEIWKAVQEVVDAGLHADVITVSDRLDVAALEKVGGLAYLAELANNVPGSANASAYAAVIRERYRERQWRKCADKICSVLNDNEIQYHADRMSAIESLLTAMGETQRADTRYTLKESLKEYVQEIDFKFNNPGIHGLLTGFRHLDERLNGMQPGDFIVVAGRPAMGKTAVATNMALNFAKAGKRGIIYSLEMPHKKLTQRMVAGESSIKLGLLQSAKVMSLPEQCDKLFSGVKRLVDLPIIYDDQGGLSVQEISARSKREHRKDPISWIMIDHIGLVDSRRHKDRDDLNIADVTRTLKRLAKELGCVVIALSQVNRKCEERGNKKPRMSDLLGSSAIEQDADAVLMLYRDKYYNEETQFPNQIEVISAKLRDGEPGTDFLEWSGEYSRVSDWGEGMTPAHQQNNSGGYKKTKGFEGS